MPAPWTLEWYHFGDIVSLTHGFSLKTQKQLAAKLKAIQSPRLRRVFHTADPRRNRPPDVAEMVRDIVKKAGRGGTPQKGAWSEDAFAHLDIRFVTMPEGKQDEILLTPGTLYLSWPAFAADPKVAARLQRFGIKVDGLPEDARDGHHMWMMATMRAADALAKCEPDKLPPGDLEGTFDAIQEKANKQPNLSSRGGGPQITANREIGRFFAFPKMRTLRRDLTYIQGHGTSRDGHLALQIGTGEDLPPALMGVMFDPWPCGKFTGCLGVLSDCE